MDTSLLTLSPGDPLRLSILRGKGIGKDKEGNIYIGDFGGCTIWKIDIRGVLSRFAGVGSCVSPPDGADLTSAGLGYINDLVYDSIENRLLLSVNYRIRAIPLNSSPPTIYTVAGGTIPGYQDGASTSALFSTPQGIAVDSKAIYVADTWNHKIRRIDRFTREVTTIAGGYGSPQPTNSACTNLGDGQTVATNTLDAPHEITVDTTSTFLYIADLRNSMIRRLDLFSTQITTVAGICKQAGNEEGTPARSRKIQGPMSLSFTPQNSLIIGEFGGGVKEVTGVIELNTATLFRRTTRGLGNYGDFLPLTESSFQEIHSLLYEDGGVYLVTKRSVRFLLPWVTTFPLIGPSNDQRDLPNGVGTVSPISTIRGVTVTTGGKVFFASCGSVYSLENGIFQKLPGLGLCYTDIEYDPVRNQLILLDVNGLYRYPLATSTQETVLTGLNSAWGITLLGDEVYIADSGNHCIKEVNLVSLVNGPIAGQCGTSGYVDGPASSSRFNFPFDLVARKEGGNTVLYVADINNKRIRRVVVGGSVSTAFGNGGNFPYGSCGSYYPSSGTNVPIGNPKGIALKGNTLYLFEGNYYNFLFANLGSPPGSVNLLTRRCIQVYHSEGIYGNGLSLSDTIYGPLPHLVSSWDGSLLLPSEHGRIWRYLPP
jgi:hypothetical protein